MIKYVNLVVQVVGMGKIPLIPKDSENLRMWYSKVLFLCLILDVQQMLMHRKNSLVIVHPKHPAFAPESRILKRHGQVLQIGISYLPLYVIFMLTCTVDTSVDEVKPIKTMMKALPLIRDNVQQLGKSKT